MSDGFGIGAALGLVLVAGDLSWDTTLFVPGLPEADEKVVAGRVVEDAGGVGANAAAAAVRAGAEARLLARFGTDRMSEAAHAGLVRAGVLVSGEWADGVLARAVTLVDPGGEKRLVLASGVSMFPSEGACATVGLDDVAWVHLAPYGPRAAGMLAGRCAVAGIPWSVDLEPATFAEGVETLASVLDGAAVVFCNERAAAALGGAPEAMLPRMGVRSVVRTRGAAGASLHEAGGATFVAAPPGEVVDTTGAGDCLAGWFVARRVAGDPAGTALRRAVAAATWSCGRAGAMGSFPALTEVALNEVAPDEVALDEVTA